MEIVFDVSKLDTVDIGKVKPNSWNPKDVDTIEYQRVVSSLRKKGLRQPVIVREVDDDYEIIDGEQRWRGWRELGQSEILIYNEGEMGKQEAQELTIAYQQQVPFNNVEFATLLRDMTAEYEKLELPISDDEIKDLIATLDFDWETHYGDDDGKDKPAEEWVKMVVRYPKEAQEVIVAEFERIGDILGIDSKVDKEVRDGLILEKICVLSGDTPTESLE